MKYNIIGDIHGRTCWKDLVGKDATNIFVGDYFSPYDDYDFEHCAKNFQEIVDFAREHPETVLLIGNHDEDHWHWIDMQHASRFDIENAYKIHDLFEENKELFSLAYAIEDKCLVTHAGVSVLWYNNVFSGSYEDRWRANMQVTDLSSYENDDEDDFEETMRNKDMKPEEDHLYFFKNRWNLYKGGKLIELEYDAKSVSTTINRLWQDNPKLFHWKYGASKEDYCGNSEAQSPLWIRPEELLNANIFKGTNITQIVGHTQFKKIQIYRQVIFSDFLGTTPASVKIIV